MKLGGKMTVFKVTWSESYNREDSSKVFTTGEKIFASYDSAFAFKSELLTASDSLKVILAVFISEINIE